MSRGYALRSHPNIGIAHCLERPGLSSGEVDEPEERRWKIVREKEVYYCRVHSASGIRGVDEMPVRKLGDGDGALTLRGQRFVWVRFSLSMCMYQTLVHVFRDKPRVWFREPQQSAITD